MGKRQASYPAAAIHGDSDLSLRKNLRALAALGAFPSSTTWCTDYWGEGARNRLFVIETA
jgi:hypothetical protein